MKKWQKTLAKLGAIVAAAAIYGGAYTHCRKPHYLTGYVNVGDATALRYTGQKNPGFPGSDLVDEMVWGDKTNTNTTKYSNNAIRITIDKSESEIEAKEVQKNWKDYIKNNEYFIKNDPKWNPSKQAVFELFKNTQNENIGYEFFKERVTNSFYHELVHLNDSVNRYNPSEGEARAYLYGLTKSPIMLYKLEQMSTDRFASEAYKNSSREVLGELMSYGDMSSKRKLYQNLDKVQKRAEEILLKKYPNFSWNKKASSMATYFKYNSSDKFLKWLYNK